MPPHTTACPDGASRRCGTSTPFFSRRCRLCWTAGISRLRRIGEASTHDRVIESGPQTSTFGTTRVVGLSAWWAEDDISELLRRFGETLCRDLEAGRAR